MKLKQMLRNLRTRLGNDPVAAEIRHYVAHGRRPWSRGYLAYRDALIARVLRDGDFLQSLRERRDFPAGYGRYLDERTVEYPWLFSRLQSGPGMFLDAGSVLNDGVFLRHDRLAEKTLHIVTLAPEASCHWKLGVSYLFADLRSLPYADDVFHQIACISTLEHVGMDNAIYTDGTAFREKRGSDFERAMRELARVCKPGGDLFLTVPFGRHTDFGWYQQFDAALLDRAIAAFGPTSVEETFFRYTPDGWTFGDRTSCAGCEGFNIHATKYFNPDSDRDYDPDFAAASRGIAAVRLRK